MENKWEYDYSGTYPNSGGNNPTPASYTPIGPSGEPSMGAGADYTASGSPMPENGPSAPMGGEPQPPRMKKSHPRLKKIGAGALALVLVAGVSFGGGYAGFYLADKTSSARIVYQSANPSGTATSTDASSADGLVGVINAITPSVVEITTEQMVTTSYGFWGGQQVVSGAGSGVIFTADGYIITNAHVVEGAQQITVKLNDGTTYNATLVGSDSQSDIAVIKIDATGLTPAVLGDSDTIAIGETAIAVGNPSNLGVTSTDGIISALNRSVTVEGNTMNLIQTSAAISPGNSGGGLFNSKGELIGIVNAKNADENAEGLGFAIPINTAKAVTQDLIENGYVTGRPALGITVVSITDAQTAMQYGVSTLGAYVQSVSEGSGAANAGMKVGDRIVSVGTKTVTTATDVTNALQDYTAGDTVQVQVDRSGELITLNVVLGEKTQA
ncbi:trypsin-like peptidase domain-containing protein [Gemmiger sp. An50]|uniref:S1C family serine protease n=1 Tax=Gemmiger sp. An50 TaxID=1965639 RepID=UPI000B394132|nr:trypsin-like peptidase domain-containing protein [Gemmiger sp. An50]OUN84751.1 serine protease HtrA [Gemmiger sp. An50]